MMSLGNNGHRSVSVAGERQQKQTSKNKRRSEARLQNFSDRGAAVGSDGTETERQSEAGGSVGEIIIDARWGGEKRGRLHHLFKKKIFDIMSDNAPLL
jgi:hypothetical protein